MPNCNAIDPFVTPYVDGEIGSADRTLVDEHLRVCPPCHARLAAERAMHDLIRAKKAALHGVAPEGLRARCASQRMRAAAGHGAGLILRPADTTPRFWRAHVAPLALAASLILLLGGTFVYELTERSTNV